MKKITILLITALLSCAVFAQENAIDKHFAEQERDTSFTKLNVTKKTFKLFEAFEAQSADEKSVLGAIAKLNGIKVLHKEEVEQLRAVFRQAELKMRGDVLYEELMSVQNEEDNVLFMIREDKDIIRELFLLVGVDDEFALASLYGEIDLNNLSKLTEVIRKNGKEWFEIFENIDSDELVFNSVENSGHSGALIESDLNFRVFPNPADDFVRIETLDGSDGTFRMEFFSGIGEQVSTAKEITLPYRLNIDDLPGGAYFLRLTDADGNFKNIRIVKK